MWDRSLPVMRFDFKVGDFPRTVPEAVIATLAENGRPQREYQTQVRAYGRNRKLENQDLLHHLKIAAKFVNIQAEDWRVLYTILGPKKREEAARFIEGCPPPRRVWEHIERLRKSGDHALADFLEAETFDLIEVGERYKFPYFSKMYVVNAIIEAGERNEKQEATRPAFVTNAQGVTTKRVRIPVSTGKEKPPF